MDDRERDTILVVDDAADNIVILADILVVRYRVIFATNGSDALTVVRSEPPPSLILLDVMMPGMDGHEVCRRLKDDPATRGIPVIFLTALSEADDEELGLKLGAVDYLLKPCRPAIVLHRVRIHIDLYNQNRALEDKVRERTRDSVASAAECRRAEVEARRLNQELERRVSERTAELSVANSELASFSYAVSHDLRAPLRAIQGFSRALLEDQGETIGGEAKGHLDQIAIACRKMSDLIDSLLALSRSTRGELRRVEIDISALAARLLEDMAGADRERTVDWQIEPGLRTAGDPRMIEVALHNLLDNAWKYTGKTAHPVIRVFSGPSARGLGGFCIADNGAGFDMLHAGHIYEPFRRLHRQDEFPGLGLGLATVQRIVRRHGGEISAEAVPGAGATFHFTLADAGGRTG